MATDRPDFRIELREVSKQFGRDWVIKRQSGSFNSGIIYGIRGRNGSGKSTLMRLLSGQLSPSRGQVAYFLGGRTVATSELYQYVSWTAPYLEIIEELTVAEQLAFHFSLKPVQNGLTTDDLLRRIQLHPYRDRVLRDCSSGMRQRVLLATGLYADTPLLLLDEPTITLDEAAAEWFHVELETYAAGRLCVIASNDEADLHSCSEVIEL